MHPFGYHVTRLFRRPAGPPTKEAIAAEVEQFLSSSELGYLLAHLPPHANDEWKAALITAYDMLEKVFAAKEIGFPVDEKLWMTTCLLIKANWFLQESMDLGRLRHEDYSDFVVHAAIGLIDVVCPEKVFLKMLVEHSDQVNVVEPATLSTSLHVAVNTVANPQREQLLLYLIQADPTMARVKDPRGEYPLHAARASGYHWETGVLEALWCASPFFTDKNDRGGDNACGIMMTTRSLSTLDPINGVLRDHPVFRS